MTSVFPDGFDFLTKQAWPLMLHSRYFDPYNDYRLKMGQEFLVEPGNEFCSLPFSEDTYRFENRFVFIHFDLFRMMFNRGKEWNMLVFEQGYTHLFVRI